jgi:hypothetical protein
MMRREGEAFSKAAAIVLTEGEDFMSLKIMSLKIRGLLTFAFAIVVANGALAAEAKRPNNLVLFVADGLRASSFGWWSYWLVAAPSATSLKRNPVVHITTLIDAYGRRLFLSLSHTLNQHRVT